MKENEYEWPPIPEPPRELENGEMAGYVTGVSLERYITGWRGWLIDKLGKTKHGRAVIGRGTFSAVNTTVVFNPETGGKISWEPYKKPEVKEE